MFFHKLYQFDPELFEKLPAGRHLDQSHTGAVPFFGTEFSEVGYTFLIQGLLGGVFLLVLLRRWRDEHANPLGKLWAPLLCGGVQLLLLGNALPLVDQGHFLRAPTRLAQFNPLVRAMDTPVARAYLIAAVYGLVSLVLAAILLHVTIAPRQRIDSALRRALRSGRRVPWWADGASAGWVALVLGLITALGWHRFCSALFATPRLALPLQRAGLRAEQVVDSLGMIWLLPPVALAIMWLLLEGFSRRSWSLFALGGWMLPTMVGTLVLIWHGEHADWALHLVAISPIGQACGALLPVLGRAMDHWWVAELARWAQVWIVVHALVAAGLLQGHWRRRRARRRRLEEEVAGMGVD